MEQKIMIIGAGPAGLGAAYRLQELGYRHWEIFERHGHIGGLAASRKDDKHYTWDIGAKAIYTQYAYIDRMLDKLIGQEYIVHQRNTWVWVLHHWVPYPFQNNIRYLPKDKVVECLLALFKASETGGQPKNFEEWIIRTFGAGIAKYFMLPYNRKLWAYPLEKMDMDWLSQRISLVNLERIIKNVIYEQNDTAWGENVSFKIPTKGGTGALFDKLIASIQDHLSLEEEMVEVDIEKKNVRFRSGREEHFDILINTIPLDLLVKKIPGLPPPIIEAGRQLEHNGLFCVGLGLEMPCPSDMTWVYFPEENCCFHRVSYLSNYSPFSVPDSKRCYSMICETTYSKYKPVDENNLIKASIEGLIETGILKEDHKRAIVTTHLEKTEYAYPIPTTETPKALSIIQPYLESKGIYSRGRFGAWTYKLGNIDHSIMQGVEAVDKVLSGESSTNVASN